MIGHSKISFAFATSIGTAIGVGLFALPYLASQTSFATLLAYFIVLGILITIIQLIYGEIITKTEQRHQLSGYAKIHLGPHWQPWVFVVEFLGIIGALTAYLVVGGKFLYLLSSPLIGGGVTLYVLIYFSLGTLLVYWGIQSVAGSELVLVGLLIGTIIFLFLANYTRLDFQLLTNISAKNLFLPYGAVLFALWNGTVIPEVAEVLDKNHRQLKKIIILSTLLSIILYIIFVITVFGLSGDHTSSDALTGLAQYFSPTLLTVALVLGLLATFTSFISLAMAAKNSLTEDWRLKPRLAWFGVCFLPLALYFLGAQNFLTIISLTGAIMFGAYGFLILLIYLKIKNRPTGDYHLNLPKTLVYFLGIVLALGVIGEIFYTLTR
ncbi:MAG: aromatic amino acid transport family protein [Patescibacteria group bacterium]